MLRDGQTGDWYVRIDYRTGSMLTNISQDRHFFGPQRSCLAGQTEP